MPKGKYKISDKWPGVYGWDSAKNRFNGKPDICFYIAYRVAEKIRWEKIGWKSEGYSPQVAAELRATRVRAARHGETVKTAKEINQEKQRTNRTIDELKVAYFASEKGVNLKGRRTDLNRYEKHLQASLGNKCIDALCMLDIERLKKEMRELAPATVANTLELLRRIINHGAKHNLCPSLSFTIELPAKNNEVTEYLTEDEAQRLMAVLDAWPEQDAPRMLKIAWLTGMRRGEIFKLEDRDIDFDQELITLRDPKGGKTESVSMSQPVADLLRLQMAARDERYPGSTYIFPGRYGGKRTDSSSVARIKAKAELPESFRIFHGLRHHLAVTLASSGGFTLDMIGELLTHKSVTMTRRYAKFLPAAKKRASNQAAELLQGQLVKRNNIIELNEVVSNK